MKKLTALLVLMLTMVLSILPAQAEVERSKLLDAAFSMLEEGNDFVRRYNEMTGAEVTATFVDGCPYFFGGKADDETTLTRLFSRAPLYSKREIWEQTRFYDKGSYYLYGLDCSGFTQWVYAEAGLPKHDSLSNMILQYGKYGKNHVYSHRKGKGMPSYDKLAENLQVGDLLVAKKRARPYHDVHRHAARFWLHRGGTAGACAVSGLRAGDSLRAEFRLYRPHSGVP